jgi:hypothetical protein
MGEFSSILFARPSFFEGAARAFDIGNTLSEYNRCETGELADRLAMYADWRQVGDDIQQAMRVFASVEKIESQK